MPRVMRIEAEKLSPAKCKIKARMRIEAAKIFHPNIRQQTFPPLNALHGARSGSPQLLLEECKALWGEPEQAIAEFSLT